MALEGFDEVGISDGMNDSGLDCVKKTENGFWSTTQDVGAVLWRRMDLGLAYG